MKNNRQKLKRQTGKNSQQENLLREAFIFFSLIENFHSLKNLANDISQKNDLFFFN